MFKMPAVDTYDCNRLQKSLKASDIPRYTEYFARVSHALPANRSGACLCTVHECDKKRDSRTTHRHDNCRKYMQVSK